MILVIFCIFDPFKKAQKWKLDQFLKYTPRNIPNGVRKSKKVGSIALDNQIGRPKNVEKIVIFVVLVIFGIFNIFRAAYLVIKGIATNFLWLSDTIRDISRGVFQELV